MADNVVKEILQYVIDTAQMEAGGQRAKKIEQDIADARAKGQDTSGLQQKLEVENQAHETNKRKMEDSRLSLEKLLRSKRDMGDVVSLLGGRFQGLIGDVGGVIQLFTHLGKAAVPVVGILASLTAAVAGFGAIAKHSQDIADAAERVQKARDGLRDEALVEREKLAIDFLKVGVAPTDSVMGEAMEHIQAGGRMPGAVRRPILHAEVIARALARKLNDPFDVGQFRRGVAVSGGEAPEFGDDEAENARKLRSIMDAGNQPGADQAAAAMLKAQEEAAYRERLMAPGDNRDDRINSIVDDLRRRQIYTNEDLAEIYKFLHDEEGRKRALVREVDYRGYSPPSRTNSNAEIAETLSRFLPQGTPVGGVAPVNFTVNNYKNETNVGTVFQNRNDPRNVPTLDLASNGTAGGGMHEQ